ncbi:nuclear transport factor 2 family protein [Mycolicibacterium komossense]|uniref:Nuclear transport factor 2 family protein n=1 Tax=Mycolicibacterium komossense TaxID=1779 RepID=A0ABT3CEW0_9MYCO|nr:nuclear transport factor 2 family protein [Mycolicibacterium komossense]MCV7227936.1 nuclear transport factor 2 family protein [Mycolicibacterium komossense]
MPTRDPEVQEMLDEFALRKLVHTYCRAVDRGDFARLRSLYHRDALDSHGALTGSSPGTVTEFLDQLAATRPYIRSMQHNITTVNFAISGARAEGEIYTIATHTVAGGARDVDIVVGGRYLDKYENRDGTWKFVERMIVTDWAHVNDPSSVNFSHPITAGTPLGAPDETDPSHGFFALLNRPAPPAGHSSRNQA